MKATPEQIAYMADLKASMRPVIDRHPGIGAVEMLAVTSQLVGNLIAVQDQRKITPAEAMEIVKENIQIGNTEAINTFLGKTEGAA